MSTETPKEARKLTSKQEAFCQRFVELNDKTEAYRRSYNAVNMKSNTISRRASELAKQPQVHARIEQLRMEHRERHNITVDVLLLELEEARTMALTCETPQTSSAISATMGKAKLLGLDKQVVQHTGEIEHGVTIKKPTIIKLVAP